jgi:phosphoribosylglycinamide formyltransferase-1
MKIKYIAIFASGTGSNAQKIIAHFEKNTNIKITLVVSNKVNAGVLDIAKNAHIDTFVVNRDFFYNSEQILTVLKQKEIDLIVLAGFLWLIPSYLVQHFPNQIINIHPALLPKYGGKGMYGHRVHEAVKAAGETESGMTIHFVNEHYDDGNIIFQAKCALSPEDDAEMIAKKVLALEHRYFAEVIEGESRKVRKFSEQRTTI